MNKKGDARFIVGLITAILWILAILSAVARLDTIGPIVVGLAIVMSIIWKFTR